jgi:hypothetical protein
MASFRDPARSFNPIEVIERLLEIKEFFGDSPTLYISSDEDIAIYMDTFGFDVYSFIADTRGKFSTTSRTTAIVPNGSRSHDSATAH